MPCFTVTSDRLMAYRDRRGREFRSRETGLTTMAGRLRRDRRARRRLTSCSASRSSASASMNSFTNVGCMMPPRAGGGARCVPCSSPSRGPRTTVDTFPEAPSSRIQRASRQAGAGISGRPGRSLASSTRTGPGGDLQASHAAPSRWHALATPIEGITLSGGGCPGRTRAVPLFWRAVEPQARFLGSTQNW